MLTPAQNALIKATVPLLESGGEALTRHFYQMMLNEYPEVRALFNQAHQASGGQQRALANAVLMYARHIDRLEALGLTVVQLEPKTHADVRRVLGTLSDLLGVPRAQGADRLWRVIDAGVLAAAQSLPPRARNVRVYFEVSRGPYAAGEVSFIGETLTRLGVRNVVPASLGPFPRLNPEFVVRANPDIIMIGNRSMQAMVPYPGWATLRAIRENRLCVFGPGDSDVVVRPGPRMAEAARIMARCLADKAP